jgi:aryl carrier-like protein
MGLFDCFLSSAVKQERARQAGAEAAEAARLAATRASASSGWGHRVQERKAGPAITTTDDRRTAKLNGSNFNMVTGVQWLQPGGHNRGVHTARFTIRRRRGAMTVGVVKANHDPVDGIRIAGGGWASHTESGWGWHSGGYLLHNNKQLAWEGGSQTFKKGDVIELSLDLNQGTLHVAKNGSELGLLCGEGLDGGVKMRWAAELSEEGYSVGLDALATDGTSAWEAQAIPTGRRCC